MKKKFLDLVAGLAVMAAMVSPAHADWSQAWMENGIGSFDAIGMQRVSGGDFSTTALTFDSGATNWTAISNATTAFASFDSTTDLRFTNHLVSAPGQFVFYAWEGNTLKDSALVDTSLNITSPWAAGAPTRAEFAANAAPVPEPETYAMMLAGLGLIGFTARRRRDTSGPSFAMTMA
jgi:hypothetical protein